MITYEYYSSVRVPDAAYVMYDAPKPYWPYSNYSAQKSETLSPKCYNVFYPTKYSNPK